jgi:SAM-dependent methyltransferase
LWLYIQNETSLTDGGNHILHFAPTNKIKHKLAAFENTVTTVDLQMDSVDVRADITRLPFAEESFDAILCSHVLEHIPADRVAMSEMSRVLAPDGDALIMVPKDTNREQTYEDPGITSPEGRRREFGQWNHVRRYGRDFSTRLSEHGFSVSTVTYIEKLDSDTINTHFGKEYLGDIHHCTKDSP